jgi:ABC-type multidrug transport system fused ATPase/permease subunit
MIQVDPPDYPPWPTARRLTPLWWGQRTLVLLALFCALVYVGLSLGIPILIQRAIDNAIVPGNPSDVWPYVIAIMVLAVIRFWINFTRRYATARIGVRIEAQLREMLFAGYLRFPRAFFDRHPTGQVVSRATNDLFPIRYFIGWGVVQGVQSAMMIVGGAIVLASINPRLTLYTGVATPLIAFVAWRFAHLVMPISRQVQARKGDVTEAADEAVVGIEMVQAFGREDDVRRRFGGKAKAVRDTVINQAGVESQHLPALFFLPTISIAAVVFFGGRDVINGDLTIGQFVLFNTILLQLAWPLEALGWILNLAQRAIASAGRSFAWLEEVSYLPEPDEPAELPEGGLGLQFQNVHFAYVGEEPVLRGIDLDVPAGEILAVCGPTGSGKSTLLNLAPRLYDPTEGRLLLGGVDVRDLRLATLRNAVAVITQRPILFSITLRENVTAGRPDAPWDEVEAMCRAAGVSEFADELPDGYETLIGERGVNLSGGQRQRVALARALVAGTRVIVMDDPLSAVDTHTEHELVEGLRPVLEGRTVLLATQRLSTLELADRAVVLRDGKIAEDGLPGELLVGDGDFAALFGEELIGV